MRNLRQGGGRKDRYGWTEHKRRSNRVRFDSLRPFIKTGVTIIYPDKATPVQLCGFNASVREFCREKKIPARTVWEGPNRHQHVALGIEHDTGIERVWKRRLEKRWLKVFGEPMPEKAFLWEPDIEPDKIASYFSKTRNKGGATVKCAWSWLRFNPVWEVGFREYSHPSEKQRVKSASRYSAESKRPLRANPWKKRGYHQPAKTSENKGEKLRPEGAALWTGWGRSYWDSFPLRIHGLPRPH